MLSFKIEKKTNHEIPLNQIPYNAELIRNESKKKVQKKKIIKILFTVMEGCLGVLAIFLVVSFWSSKNVVVIGWGQLPVRHLLHIKMCATAFLKRINDNYSSIIKQVAVANIGHDAKTRIIVGAGQIQNRCEDNSFLIASAATDIGLRISNNYNSGDGLGRINDVISANLKTVGHGSSQIYINMAGNNSVIFYNWLELRHVLKENWDKLISFVIKG